MRFWKSYAWNYCREAGFLAFVIYMQQVAGPQRAEPLG